MPFVSLISHFPILSIIKLIFVTPTFALSIISLFSLILLLNTKATVVGVYDVFIVTGEDCLSRVIKRKPKRC